MAKPVIIAVDDEPQVLNAVERDLRKHFSKKYKVLKALSGKQALEIIHELKHRNMQLSLMLVDQRMPGMLGTEFISKAIKLYPDAKRALLTAYADTQAAIDSINAIGLDHYLMKPWDPPEEKLYPMLDDLLSDWKPDIADSDEGLRVAGTLWSAKSHDVKDFLARNQIPYKWLDIEKDKAAKELVDKVSKENKKLPVVFFADGSYYISPSNKNLAEKVGLQTRARDPFYDLIIVGAGPAGLGAAVYGGSEGLHIAVIERHATGGQAGTSSFIENYLGFPKGISGADLARRATAQAKRFGAEILTAQEVKSIELKGNNKVVTLSDDTKLSCKALLIATGVAVKTLSVPGAKRLSGAGVYYGAATTEAAYYKNKHVFVVGGTNSAGQGAMFFSRYAKKTTVLIRGGSTSNTMSQYLVDQINRTKNVEILTNTEVVKIKGDKKLNSIVVKNNLTNATRSLKGSAIFIFIGAVPHSQLIHGLVKTDNYGFILTGTGLISDGKRPSGWTLDRDPYLLETNVPGIFAAGDIRQGVTRRVASAIGAGAIAISQIHHYLKTV